MLDILVFFLTLVRIPLMFSYQVSGGFMTEITSTSIYLYVYTIYIYIHIYIYEWIYGCVCKYVCIPQILEYFYEKCMNFVTVISKSIKICYMVVFLTSKMNYINGFLKLNHFCSQPKLHSIIMYYLLNFFIELFTQISFKIFLLIFTSEISL